MTAAPSPVPSPAPSPVRRTWDDAADERRRVSLADHRRAHHVVPLRPATLVRRAVGATLDALLVLAVLSAADGLVLLGARVFVPAPSTAPGWQVSAVVAVLVVVDGLLWYRLVPARTGRDGATLGMRAVGIAAVDPETRVPGGLVVAALRVVATVLVQVAALVAALAVLGAAAVAGTEGPWRWWAVSTAALVVAVAPHLWATVDPAHRTVVDRLTHLTVVRA